MLGSGSRTIAAFSRGVGAVLLAALVAGALDASHALAADASAEAARLHRDALRRLAKPSPEQRQFARRQLEAALLLEPDDTEIALALGRLYMDADMMLQAKVLAADLARRAPDLAGGHFLLGESWRRDWLATADEISRDRAIACLARGLKLEPRDFTHGQMLVPLLEDAGEPREALAVAELAARAAATRPEAWLLLGYAAQFAGETRLADRMFARALPGLPPALRARYEDLSPLFTYGGAESYRSLGTAARATSNQRFWRAADPDPVSSENEAQLEFWARLTHALLLYGVDDLGELDARGQIYVRFGAPRFVDRNPPTNPHSSTFGTWMSWTYPELGMRVWLNAAHPLAHYRARYGSYVRAFPESLARRPELRGVHGGWAVFRTIPVGLAPLQADCAVARFEGGGARQLLAQVEAAAPPGSRLRAEWAVLDADAQAVARGEVELRPSACDADARAATITAELPPGRYQLAVRADDDAGRRAVLSRDVVITAPRPVLELSDLVVVCGRPELSVVPGGGLRLEPSTGLLPLGGDQLNAYCEIYRLLPGPSGEASYEYVCTVTSNERDGRSWLSRFFEPRPTPAPIEVSRREVTRGDMRRQYFSVPVQPLPPGRYRIQVRVRDLVTRVESSASADFERR